MEDRQELNRNLAQMLKGGVIMDVTTPEQARIAEEAGARHRGPHRRKNQTGEGRRALANKTLHIRESHMPNSRSYTT